MFIGEFCTVENTWSWSAKVTFLHRFVANSFRQLLAKSGHTRPQWLSYCKTNKGAIFYASRFRWCMIVSYKKAQLSLTNPRDAKACQKCSNSTCLQRCRWQYWPIFIRLAVVARNPAKFTKKYKLMEFKIIQSHRSWCQWKAHMWLPISH